MTPKLPSDDPSRVELNDEVHARPSAVLIAPLRFTYLALRTEPQQRIREWECLAELARRLSGPPPAPQATHYSSDFGAFRLRWERHSEFTRYMLIVPGVSKDPFADSALAAVPADWIESLPGKIMVATHGALISDQELANDTNVIAAELFHGNALVGSSIAGGTARALTDFRIQDCFSRLLLIDRGMTPRQAGRMVQRLLEMDTYRMMALLALPVARELAPLLSRSEQDLIQITNAIASPGEQDEPTLLAQLTRLEAQINSRESQNHFRFTAAAAYYKLVKRRIRELREERIPGLQTFHEFMERRLAPAMDTCLATMTRQQSLSERVARATRLLSTRVEVIREQQTHAVLDSMNRRAQLQLRLQETVEGLSVAAVTYYGVGLVAYAAKGIKAAGIALNPDTVAAISIPVLAALVLLGVRKIRKIIARGEATTPSQTVRRSG